MLQKQYRLKSRPAFKKALSGRTFCTSRYFAMYALPHAPSHAAQPPRFGFIVSKKVDKRATRRNRIKRRLREAVRQTLLVPPLLEQISGYRVIVLIARQAMAEASPEVPFEELCRQLRRCFAPSRV